LNILSQTRALFSIMAMADSPSEPPSLLETSRRALPSFSDPTTNYRQFGPTGDMMAKTGTFAALTGLVIGYSRGAKMAGLRFRAEHAHKMPRDTRELYFYHRRKNYYVAKHGLQRGFGMAGRLAFWTSLFFLAEASADFLRGGRKDFVSTTTAGIGVAGLFSVASK
jgi:hypothetical protein